MALEAMTAAHPIVSEVDWRKLAEKALKGEPFESLIGRTVDGVPVLPLYKRCAGRLTAGSNAGAPWRVAARVDHPSPQRARDMLVEEMRDGATALTIVWSDGWAARGYGVDRSDGVGLEALVATALAHGTPLRLDVAAGGIEAATNFAAQARRLGHDADTLDIDFGIDPIGNSHRTGRPAENWKAVTDEIVDSFGNLRDQGFKAAVLTADGRAYHEAGASEAQELACVVATLAAYMRALSERSVPLDSARSAVSAILAADADEYLTIAKFRAMRRLWARMEQVCGLTPKALSVHAETSWLMMTRRDPWVNILRCTIAAFSAGLGGADTIVVSPFTQAIGLPDRSARRLARNTQLILLEEANLWRVVDPAAGSGALEGLTTALCEKAWELFQGIERLGGMQTSAAVGYVAEQLRGSRCSAYEAVTRGRRPITGTTAFANLSEGSVAVDGVKPLSPKDQPLPVRWAEPFESFRDAAEAHAARQGEAPRIFLAMLGRPADFTRRASVVTNLFASGGVQAVGGGRFDTADGVDLRLLERGFRESGAQAACIVSSDAVYNNTPYEAAHPGDTLAEEVARLLRDAGAGLVAIAGSPCGKEADLRQAGIDAFITPGCDAIEILNRFYRCLR